MSKIDQKEYLKKYLSGDKKKRKKKKLPSNGKVKVNIIDDDVDVVKRSLHYDDDLILTGEDAPQIVGIIDDRPAELKTIEDFRSSGKWKSFSKLTGDSQIKKKSFKLTGNKNDFSPERTPGFNGRSRSPIRSTSIIKISDDDYSPPRKSKVESSRSSPSRIKSNRDSEDYSPPRKSSNYHSPSPVRSAKDDDFSPPRKGRPKDVQSEHTSRKGRPKKYSDEEPSPKKKLRYDSGSDYSPPRRNTDEKSNGRKKSRWGDYNARSEKEEKSSRRSKSSDLSPPRRRKEREDPYSKHSKPYSSHASSQGESSRSSYKRRSEDLSPRRHRDDSKRKFTNTTPPRNAEDNDDFSPPRRKNTGDRERKEKASEKEKVKPRPSRTLDGKTAGLQDAKLLKEETDKFRKREDELFQKMAAEVSGKDANIVVRNRRVKTASELQKEEERERERSKRDQEKQEAYDRWGLGLKQIEDYKTKIAEEIHESSKPLARYSDDADLDEMLKKQERLGDPMLQYIREKHNEKNKSSNAKTLPIYKGSFPENRFNIRPGYRWDGVDRSTGYERKWFDIQNQKKALQEEAYKYSVEDM